MSNVLDVVVLDRIPYTYVILFEDGFWYYGVRYKKGCHPDDLGKTYFTSSKVVREKVKTQKYQTFVRKTFSTVKHARNWESKCLRRLLLKKEANDIKILNLHFSTAVDPSVGAKTKITKTKSIDENGLNIYQQAGIKISNKIKGRSKEEQFKINKKISNKNKGKPGIVGDTNPSKRIDVRKKISNAWHKQKNEGRLSLSNNKGKTWYNNGQIELLSPILPSGTEWKLGRLVGKSYSKHKRIVCNICGKEGGASAMKRYHFSNCKENR